MLFGLLAVSNLKAQVPSGTRVGTVYDVSGAGDTVSWVLYIELPQGQVSFHAPQRAPAPTIRADGTASI